MKLSPQQPASVLLVVLLATDLLLIVGHILFLSTSWVYDYNYSIVEERGFAETFQYFKCFWLVLMFGWLVLITRERSYLAWAAVFGYLGLDDLREIHEEMGNTLATRLEFVEFLGQRPRDIGELVVFAIAGLVLLTFLAIAWYRGSETFRDRSKVLLRMSALLMFFGIAVDTIHILFLETVLDHPFGILEDGGEMVMLSIICWYVFRLLTTIGAERPAAEHLASDNGHAVRRRVKVAQK